MEKPLLRPLDFQPAVYQGEQMWLLRDPLELTDFQLIFPPAMAQMLLFCDGTRTPREIQAAFSAHLAMPIDFETVERALEQLDQACLLENERSRQATDALLADYRAQAYRPPALAGHSYAADPAELTDELRGYGLGDNLDDWPEWRGRGIISPHIDYQRGGPVYARVWRRVAAAVEDAELVLIFGTDHYGSNGSVTLTRQRYATPYGVLPTDQELIDELARALGPTAFAEELHHRKEHSVELSAVWFHHIRGSDPPPVVPILCGSFNHFVENGHHPADSPKLNAFIDALRRATSGRKVLAVASVDLAHVGPAFGDEFSMDATRRARLVESDDRLMAAIGRGDDAIFYQEIAAVRDRHRICGFSSIYLMLRFLGRAEGSRIAYKQCPADQADTSLVSICGLLLD